MKPFATKGLSRRASWQRGRLTEKDISETDRKVCKDIIALFTNVAYYLTQRGKLVKIGRGPDARWKLAPIEPELF